jgi:tetratricopeptide (TPR) repeat protein
VIVEEAIGRAVASFERGEWPVVAEICGSILVEKPECFDALVLQSMAEHQLGNHDVALVLVEQSLLLKPDSPEALAHRGIIFAAKGDMDDAIDSYTKALLIRPEYHTVLFNRANALQSSQYYEEALQDYDQFLSHYPQDAGALNNRGVVLYQLDRCQDALDSYARSLVLRPDSAETFNNRGNALQHLDYNEEALQSYERAIELCNEYPEAWNNRANALQSLGRFDDALASSEAATRLSQSYAEAFNTQASILLDLGRAQEALGRSESALELRADYAEALGNQGSALLELCRFEEALSYHERAFALQPGSMQALNVGNAQQALGRHELALLNYDMALTIRPDYAEAYNNRGTALQSLNRIEAALHHYEKAVELRPDDAKANWNESLARLTLGDYRVGWEKYEWRWQNADVPVPDVRSERPVWTGEEDVQGRTVLVYTEQGFGDAIQFIRFATLLAERGATVVVACHGSLTDLFSGVAGVSRVLGKNEILPEYDYHVALMSLPLAFKMRVRRLPGKDSYLVAEEERRVVWREKLDANNQGVGVGHQIGIVWSGNPSFSGAARKACPLADYASLLVQPGCNFVSLQKGDAVADLDNLDSALPSVTDWSRELNSFADTAALIAELDLVITVDTAVAHLAAGLGKPTWIVLPFAADWRWMAERSDSPWYTSARLFRQSKAGDWGELMSRVSLALQDRLSGQEG